MGRKRIFTDEEREERRKRPTLKMKLEAACDQVLKEIQENPPRLICWLQGGVNLSRANKIREEIEKRERVTSVLPQMSREPIVSFAPSGQDSQ